MKKWLNFIFLLPLVCHALDSDKEQPIFFKADSAEINYKTGLSYYHGHVMFDQGTTHIRANDAKVQINSKHQLIEATAIGNTNQLAEYQTLPKNDDEILYAKAQTIIWYALQKKINLIDNAIVHQGKNSYTAPKINYDMIQQHVSSPLSKNGKTVIMVYPKETT